MRIVMLFLATFLTSPLMALTGDNLMAPGSIDLGTGGKRGLVLIFMSAKCPCSASHVGVVKKLAREYADFKFAVVHANADESRADAKAYFDAQKFELPIIEDANRKLVDQFGASRTPHAFVVQPDGKVVYRGGVSDSHDGEHASKFPLREALDDVMAGKAVRRADARALGCAISRERS